MTVADIEAIAGGYHTDPFRILGPHKTAPGSEGVWEVRAFLPHAAQASVVVNGDAIAMTGKHAQGFFVAALPGEPGGYRLRAALWSGGETEFDDPYRFPPLASSFDLHLHAEGTNYHAYNLLGAHLTECDGVAGALFTVWAPHALVVSVCGSFNEWDARRHPMRLRDGGVWEIFIPGVKAGDTYKYSIQSKFHGLQQLKADPCAFAGEPPPKSASVVADISRYQWADQAWMQERARRDLLREPVSIYEVHLESWMRGPRGDLLTYRELADLLVDYAKEMGYTHIELLPIQEYPFSGSWGYQVIGYFAPTARFGPPEDFMCFIDRCHQAGLGVIVDWVPAHFPKDAHGLAYFDGTALYEHEDPRKGEQKDWGTLIFNFGRNEVRSFLVSSAMFWLEKYHIDGLRVDAVASMLYLDYSRQPGEWLPNRYGGNENLEAIEFLKIFNAQAHQAPGAVTIAEESTAFPGVSRPVHLGGLGFTMKWNMGWMHDMLRYFALDPIYRKFNHNHITFSLLYAFSENYVLPISHDEVVHGKSSLIGRMPGDEWRRFANVRAFLGYMYGHPGKKLLFMGCEIGQYEEWDFAGSVRWELLQFDYHRGLQQLNKELNRFYRSEPALYEDDYHWTGFEWVDFRDADASVISFLRLAADRREFIMFVCNFTPVPRHNYRLGVPAPGRYNEAFNTDWRRFGGSDTGNFGGVAAQDLPSHGHPYSLVLTLPPLAVIALKPER